MDSASGLSWPVGRLADAVEQLARASGLVLHAAPGSPPTPRRGASSAESAEGGVEHLSRTLEFEAESSDVTYAEAEHVLRSAGPALLKITGEDGDSYLALLDSSGRTVRLLAPDGRRYRIAATTVAGWLRRRLEQPIAVQVDQLLADSNVPPARRSAARFALLGSRLGPLTVSRCWMLRPTPSASLWQHMRHTRLPRRLLVFLLAYAGAAVASVGAWRLIGVAAMEGRFDPGTLLAWSFLLLSLVPLGLFAMWSQGIFMLGVGGILKMQLLAGALKLDPDDTRHQGIGQHLARVIESESIEAMALAGGFYSFTALFDLVLAILILATSSGAVLLTLLLVVLAIVAAVAFIYFRSRERWTASRLHLTHDLVERMVGHRTRLVQEAGVARHDEEDEAVDQYLVLSKQMDRRAMLLSGAPRAWLLVGLAGLAPQFVDVASTSTSLAVGVGVILLVYGALGKMTTGLSALADAAISWKQVAPLVEALRRPEPIGHIDRAVEPIARSRSSRSGPLVAAQDLAYRYRDRGEAVLRGCSFRMAVGDRIHLSGASGGGKSTLVSLLTGMRVQDSGLLLLDGLDRATLGTRAWRRRVAAAPQFHENHVFNETLAFNLLMGRRWPPAPEDLHLAESVCRRLGLGDLVDRMPGGLFQVVGETGWQLSHGERSRLFMARALLQGADLVVLDESFAELDPDSLRRCLPEAAELSKSLMVVAHT